MKTPRAHNNFSNLKVVARARDLTHWHQLRDLGVEQVQRELFESSLHSAHTVLELIGLSAVDASALTQRFRTHNINLANRMYPHHNDRAKLVAVAREGRRQLAEQMTKERQEREEQAERQKHPPEQGSEPLSAEDTLVAKSRNPVIPRERR